MNRWVLVVLAGFSIASSYGRDPMVTAKQIAQAEDLPMLVEIVSSQTAHAQTFDRFLQEDPANLEILRERFGSTDRARTGLTNVGLLREADSWRGPDGGTGNHIRFAVEDYPEVAERLRITTLPTLLVVAKGSDEPIARLEGLPENAAAVRRFLQSVAPSREYEAPEHVTRPAATPPAAAPVAVNNMVTIPWTAVAPTPVVLAQNTGRTTEQPAVHTYNTPTPVSATVEATEGRFTPDGEREVVYDRSFPQNTLWTITLEAEPGNEDLDLKVEGPNEELIESSEGAEASERIVLAVTGGASYKLRVYAFRGVSANVTYRLRETFEPLSSDRIVPEIPQSIITEDEEKEVELEAGLPTWIRFTAPSPGRYQANFKTDPGILLDVHAVAADGMILGRGDADGVSFETVRGGGIHLRIVSPRNTTPAVTVTRDRSVNLGAISETIRPGREAADRVGGDAGLERLYRVSPDGEGVWIFELLGDPEEADIDLEILDGAGQLIERAEGPAGREKIVVKIEAGEERIARVYVYRADAAVPFHLTMTRGTEEDLTQTPGAPEPPPTPPADAPVLRPNDQRMDAVGKNQTRWYQIEPSEDGLLAFFIEGEEDAGDIDLAVHAVDGERLAISQSESATEAILHRVERGKTVFIRVYAYGESEGGRFRVWTLPAGR